MKEVIKFPKQSGYSERREHDKQHAAPVGHELPLAAAIKNRWIMEFKLMDGTYVYGSVSAFDKWTITIYPEGATDPITYYKQALQSFTKASSVQ